MLATKQRRLAGEPERATRPEDVDYDQLVEMVGDWRRKHDETVAARQRRLAGLRAEAEALAPHVAGVWRVIDAIEAAGFDPAGDVGLTVDRGGVIDSEEEATDEWPGPYLMRTCSLTDERSIGCPAAADPTKGWCVTESGRFLTSATDEADVDHVLQGCIRVVPTFAVAIDDHVRAFYARA